MGTISINSKNSGTYDPHRLLINRTEMEKYTRVYYYIMSILL